MRVNQGHFKERLDNDVNDYCDISHPKNTPTTISTCGAVPVINDADEDQERLNKRSRQDEEMIWWLAVGNLKDTSAS